MPASHCSWLKGHFRDDRVIACQLFLYCRQNKGALSVVTVLLIVQLLFPVFQSARPTIHQHNCGKSIRELTLAIYEYAEEHGSIPPPYIEDGHGKPLLSWRVILLPYLGHQGLYDQIDKTKEWDDPANLPFHDQMPKFFSCPSVRYHSKWFTRGNTTAYIVVVGKETPWRPTGSPPSLKEINRGKGGNRTIAIVESEKHRQPWMAPNDPLLDSFLETFDWSEPHHGMANISKFDGSVDFYSGNDKPSEPDYSFSEMLRLPGFARINLGVPER